ncbi:Protein phosphatase 2C 1 [Coelomomyces lativittatus]|nr:Protein phosphatase 2C 1 [Coelomomyces lativittatus]
MFSLHSSRVLHTANAGDARAVLCRKGKAIRLTYDHKGSDKNEATRITKAGGLVLNDRVNGVLAVTRSLGDCSMKSLVVGNPYTTSLELELDDEFLILACDGVWDVLSDQEAVNLIRKIEDPQAAASFLVQKSLENLSTDNLSVIVIRFLRNFFTSNSISKRDPDSDIEAEVNEESGGQTPTPSSVSLVFGRIGADERK